MKRTVESIIVVFSIMILVGCGGGGGGNNNNSSESTEKNKTRAEGECAVDGDIVSVSDDGKECEFGGNKAECMDNGDVEINGMIRGQEVIIGNMTFICDK